MRTSPTGKNSNAERGFTLVELCVVMLLIAALAAVAAPAFAGFLRASQERNCISRVASLAHRARDYAIVRAVRVAVEYQEQERQFRLTAETDPTGAPGVFQELRLAGALPVRLPEAVDNVAIAVEGRPATADWPLVFFPDGQALVAQIVLESQQGAWSIEVTPLTGQAKVKQGDVRAQQ